MNISQYLDSTYLKTALQADITVEQTKQNVIHLIEEAIEHQFKLVMIRPEFITLAKKLIDDAKSDVLIGTVIGFHEGINSISDKLKEAQKAIDDEVNELDFVINYNAFKNGQINLIKAEVFKGTKLALENNKVIKWIIEIAALTDEEIIIITQLIRDIVLENFGEEKAKHVFVKSSTGFFKTENGKPNGATFEGMKLIVENAKPLQSKAAGGVRNYDDAIKMIEMGVTRIGTSSAKKIVDGATTEGY
ncbi:deoxyribose-phosphate aldolase [Urechidicola croceus]|uniref:Deoxyribose-phosphate aldolase n=1 Tax=Urechidicola croceus TaxID=1850246 RepID=A0A1D8P8H7_9FLAO|nr:deoxyribose-phosphate aldolase [Urechidicola croceus]AOW20888.1 deoxyribose-phosphate aldolase [Urechidicola croceus]